MSFDTIGSVPKHNNSKPTAATERHNELPRRKKCGHDMWKGGRRRKALQRTKRNQRIKNETANEQLNKLTSLLLLCVALKLCLLHMQRFVLSRVALECLNAVRHPGMQHICKYEHVEHVTKLGTYSSSGRWKVAAPLQMFAYALHSFNVYNDIGNDSDNNSCNTWMCALTMLMEVTATIIPFGTVAAACWVLLHEQYKLRRNRRPCTNRIWMAMTVASWWVTGCWQHCHTPNAAVRVSLCVRWQTCLRNTVRYKCTKYANIDDKRDEWRIRAYNALTLHLNDRFHQYFCTSTMLNSLH